MAKRKSQKKKKKKTPPLPRKQRRSHTNAIFVAIGLLIVLSVVLGPILPELIDRAPRRPAATPNIIVISPSPTATDSTTPTPTIAPALAPTPSG